MDSFFRNRYYVLAAVLGLTLSLGAVFAQAPPLSIVPVNIAPVAAVPTGLQTMATYQATGAGAANGYYSRPVLVSNNTLGGLAKGLMRRAVPVAAMIAAVEAAGWAIDQLTGQVMNGPPPTTTAPPGTGYVNAQSQSHPSFSAAASYVIGWFNQNFPTRAPWTNQGLVNCNPPDATGFYSCQIKIQDGTGGSPGFVSATYIPNNAPGVNQPLWHVPVAPVPLSDLGQLVASNPNLWNDALRNPDGSVNRNPDVMAEAEALRQSLTNPEATPQPNPGAEWDTGYQGGEPQPGASAQPFELPAFCTWAAVVCSALEWFQDDEDTGEDVPPDFIEPSLDVSWNSGFGNGSCPAPVQFEVMGGDVLIPFDFLCDLAAYIRPVVLAAAALLALMIIGGYRRVS